MPVRKDPVSSSSASSSTSWDGTSRAEEGRRNRAVLVSVSRFDPGVKLGHRPGAARDTKRLHRTLSKMGFKVEIHDDPSADEIYSLFDEVSVQPVKECVLVVLSSHGEEGCVFGADGKAVRLSHIFSCFNNVNMEGKTKLFFIQACRGAELDDGVEVDSAVTGSDDIAEDSISQYLSVPVDTAVMYATTPGYGAFMHPLGAVFLRTLCDIVEDEACRALELTRLLTRLAHRVAYTFQAKGHGPLRGKKEMPCFLTRMTREVFPFSPSRPVKESSGGGGARGNSAA